MQKSNRVKYAAIEYIPGVPEVQVVVNDGQGEGGGLDSNIYINELGAVFVPLPVGDDYEYLTDHASFTEEDSGVKKGIIKGILFGPMTFLNHECDPNGAVTGRGKNQQHYYTTAFIPKEGQITFSYGKKYFDDSFPCFCAKCLKTRGNIIT